MSLPLETDFLEWRLSRFGKELFTHIYIHRSLAFTGRVAYMWRIGGQQPLAQLAHALTPYVCQTQIAVGSLEHGSPLIYICITFIYFIYFIYIIPLYILHIYIYIL